MTTAAIPNSDYSIIHHAATL